MSSRRRKPTILGWEDPEAAADADATGIRATAAAPIPADAGPKREGFRV